MINKCDVCGSTNDIQCEIFTKGEDIDRIYHFCPKHWIEVYRKTLDDFVEDNEYKANTYIKIIADKIIVDALNNIKIEDVADNGIIDVDILNPTCIRKISPYEDDNFGESDG